MRLAVATAGVCAAGLAAFGLTATGHAPRSALYNPQVTQATINTTICVSGWSASVRPPQAYTAPLKRKLVDLLPADADHKLSDYELDHIVPLEVGGSPANPANFMLQLWPEARAKDAVENRVHREVCNHTITLAVGRRCFVTDWKACP